MSKGHVSLSLRSLEDRGLVACRADGSDRRAVHLALTDGAGRFRRYKIVDPSFHNWMGLAMALRGFRGLQVLSSAGRDGYQDVW